MQFSGKKSIKWLNDELDDMRSLLDNENAHALKTNLNNAFFEIVKSLRLSSDKEAQKCIEWASCNDDKWIFEDSLPDVDLWEKNEKKHLETVLHALSVLKLCESLSTGGETAHATMLIDNNVFDIFVVTGAKTHEEAKLYAAQFIKGESRYAIIVTKDEHDRSLDPKKDKAIYTPEPEIDLD
ncbi:MAG: hypothetical protein HY752_00110, partial [Nitrospirae bacterium]|nr:hypothetical protein [Nitrospirota bacterium]